MREDREEGVLGREEGVVHLAVLDGHPLLTRSLHAVLSKTPDRGIEIVGMASRVDAGLRLIDETAPDVVLADLALPPSGVLEVLGAIQGHPRRPRVIVMSSVDDPEAALRAMAAGADGFCPKAADPDGLLVLIFAVVRGWTVVSRPTVEHLLARALPSPSPVIADLDRADRQLWALVAQGLEITLIAERLFVSERTAKRLVAHLRDRLGVGTRIEMALLAGQTGLLDSEDVSCAPPVTTAMNGSA